MSNHTSDRGPQVTIPNETNPAQAVNDLVYKQPRTVGFVGHMSVGVEDGVYISPLEVDPNTTFELPQITNIQLLPGLRLGAAASYHNVVFGNAALEVGGATDLLEVAIKPFVDSIESAQHEYDCLIEARQRGIDTFRPLAIVVDGETGYLVTQGRDDLETLDNADWSLSPQDPKFESKVVPNLQFLASALATIHSKGLFHRDAQPKNFAQTDTGGLVVPDLESARWAFNPEQHIEYMNGGDRPEESLAFQDVYHCWYSLIHPNPDNENNLLLEGEPVEVCMEVFMEHFLRPYFESLSQLNPPEFIERVDTQGLAEALYAKVQRTT